MTNPNDALGTNGAYGGRTSVDALNDVLSTYKSRGVLSGFICAAKSGMTVTVGGTANIRDVAIAEDAVGNKTTINNISGTTVDVTVDTASTTSDRIDAIVAYVNNPASVNTTTLDNPEAVGIISVNGTSVAPTEAAIRSAITADGGTGTTAYYVVLAIISVPMNTTTITNTLITQGDGLELTENAKVTSQNIDSAILAAHYVSKVDTGSVSGTGQTIASVTIDKDGTYLVLADVMFNIASANAYQGLGLYVDDVDMGSGYSRQVKSNSSYDQHSISTHMIKSLTVGQVVSIKSIQPSSATTRYTLSAVYIGD